RRFEALLGAHGDAVFAALLRFLGDRSEAEDVWQETAWAAWRGFSKLDPARDPAPWLRTLALNKAIDRLRRKAVRPAAAAEVDVDALRAPRAGARIDFEDDLRALPPMERAATLLRFQEGLSVADVAAALGAPEGTVKTWLFRAREKLRPRFADLAPRPPAEAKPS
ncbi:MAG TPA: sigma-70 family RNA polymerase sigma factor, partial [Planctomycetota bacterium]|nr:sigma-70 family RNA polymerase sigma factor [Planctomycetota bacterium]